MTKARRAAAALAAAAAVAAVVGSVLPLFTMSLSTEPGLVRFTMTSWSMEIIGGISLSSIPADGYPLVFAAVLMAFAAVAGRVADRPGASPRTDRVADAAILAGAAFLACATWMVTLQVISWEDTYGPKDSEVISYNARTEIGGGLWILLTGALLGIAAAVLRLLAGSRSAPAVEVDPDAPTPPFGIVLPMTAEEADEPEEPASPAVPGPELPTLGPIVIPDAPPTPTTPAGPAVPAVEDPLDEPRRD